MGYLDNTSVTVDAILTNKGRELLSKGDGTFNITQFALSDDEIDYTLWNPQHDLGSNYYGIVIENMPLTEAIPDESQVMKYKLLTLNNQNTTRIPIITVAGNSSILDSAASMTITPNCPNLANANQIYGYTAILSDSSVANIAVAPGFEVATSLPPTSPGFNVDPTSITVIGKSFIITANSVSENRTATVTFIANETGGTASISFTVLQLNVAGVNNQISTA